MKKVIQFQVGSFGEFYLLFTDGTMAQGEAETTEAQEGRDSDLKINITRKIILPMGDNENSAPVKEEEGPAKEEDLATEPTE